MNGSLKGVGSDRADRDSNWRNHPSDKEAYLNPKPPFGSKSKNKQKNKTKAGKCSLTCYFTSFNRELK